MLKFIVLLLSLSCALAFVPRAISRPAFALRAEVRPFTCRNQKLLLNPALRHLPKATN